MIHMMCLVYNHLICMLMCAMSVLMCAVSDMWCVWVIIIIVNVCVLCLLYLLFSIDHIIDQSKKIELFGGLEVLLGCPGPSKEP